MSGLAGVLDIRGGVAGGLSIAFDGRLDNRGELLAGSTGSPAPETDGDLVLRAYERWGETSPAHLLGDFAFAIWDPRLRRLFCARDHLGIRPFYYFTDGRIFAWASEPHQLFQHAAVPKRPNEAMVVEYLAADLYSFEETLYQGILRLPPAHSITVDAAGVRKQRYWGINPDVHIRYKRDAEYAEHFYSVFKETVRCRLRSDTPVAAELSGGVDSSCIVGMCEALFRDGAASGEGFETLSLVFPGYSCDETDYLRQVVRYWDLTSNEVPVPSDPEWYFDCARRYLYLPDHANCHMSDFPATLAQQKGIRVILTGLGGDDWFTGVPPWQGSRARRVLRRLRQDPASLFTAARRRLGRHTPERPCPWIPEPFYARHKPQAPAGGAVPAGLEDAFRTHFLEIKARASARCGVDHRHPFHDRRLIELSMAFPPDQLRRGEQGKFVLRQAMKGLVPDPILQRSTKAEFSHTSALLFGAESIAPLFRSLRIAEQGWLDAKQTATMYQNFMNLYRSGVESPPHVWPLSMILAVELWFRAAFA